MTAPAVLETGAPKVWEPAAPDTAETEVTDASSSEQSQGSSETVPQETTAVPVLTSAPKVMGISMQSFWVTVKVQEVLLPLQGLVVLMTGAPQQ